MSKQTRMIGPARITVADGRVTYPGGQLLNFIREESGMALVQVRFESGGYGRRLVPLSVAAVLPKRKTGSQRMAQKEARA